MREAVKRFDVSKPTLLKDLASGKASGAKNGAGQWSLDPAELARVYQARGSNGGGRSKSELTASSIVSPPTINAEMDSLKTRLAEAEKALAVERERAASADRLREVAERLAEERAEWIADLRRMLPPPTEHARPARKAGWMTAWFNNRRT